MRRALVVILILVGFGYVFITPYLSAQQLRSALSDGDRDEIERLVDFGALRSSAVSLIASEVTGRETRPTPVGFLRSIAGAASRLAASEAAEVVISPSTLPLFFGEARDWRSIIDLAQNKSATTTAVPSGSFDDAVKRGHYRTIDTFIVSSDVRLGEANVSLVFSRSGLVTWRVVGVTLDKKSPATDALTQASRVFMTDKTKSRSFLNSGVQAFKNADYPRAAQLFLQAVEADPTYPEARLYLATTYFSQYVPGDSSPANLEFARLANEQYVQVVHERPSDVLALSSIASLYYHQKKFDEAETWYRKVVRIDPNNKAAFYTLGVMAWARTYPRHIAARTQAGMAPEDAEPIRDPELRRRLCLTDQPILDQGIADLHSALKIDPEYDDAMAYLNLLLRRKGDLADDQADFKAFTDEADGWIAKNLAVKQLKRTRSDQGQ